MTKLSRSWPVTEEIEAIRFLSEQVPELSKSRLKDAMVKGCVWLQQGKKQKRLRRAQTLLLPGQQLSLHYDAAILQRQVAASALLQDFGAYSLWWKPAGVLSQGSLWGDHLSLLRQAELATKRPVFLVHRLDREASGLVLLAHQSKAAAALSQQFQQSTLGKTYHVAVQGTLADEVLQRGEITSSLDGKSCITRFSLLSSLQQPEQSWLQVQLLTGRKHQIRRHFAGLGHPVMGDPRYGNKASMAETLALQAVALEWQCPQSRQRRSFALPNHLQLIQQLGNGGVE
ncbi:RluA family pseudouridine synthase [Alkalimonas delamerensis]|uniref:RluA family pseudouridine synthase n=1 Tax=Alkalimonas delamerensis TaxID=265981 RepID=A0ABT9GLG9_9GAMM|nr:RluA family pseudouridine synthase [Alkalimonas delamerensis]MDP4527650.1 RluA family pseudouridine synthase [Alkalimonas delamerensis]